MKRREFHHMTKLCSLILAFLATSIGSTLTQSYPTRTVNIIIAFPPGGPNEGVVRFLAEKLTSSLGRRSSSKIARAARVELSVQGRSQTRHRINRLNTEINAVMKTKEMGAILAKLSAEPEVGSPEDLSTFIAAETQKWAAVVNAANIKVD